MVTPKGGVLKKKKYLDVLSGATKHLQTGNPLPIPFAIV